MTVALRYNTASQEIALGYFVDSTDGNTEETALSIANTDIKLWKNGATTLANKNSGGATHISNGIYYATLDATDTNTLGPMVIFVHVTGALPVRLECCVYPAEWYDTMVAGTDNLTADLTAAAKAAVNTEADTAIADAALATAANLATAKTVIDTIATDTTTDIPATLATLATAANLALVKADTAAILTDTGTTLDAALAVVDANVDAIKAKTDSLAFTVAGQVDANVQSINDVTITGDGSATKFGV